MSSGHPGGVKSLCGPGAVHYVGNGIRQPVYDALARRGGGEAVGDY
jgi:hypothetical protein